jgi:hypothetical protein
MDFYFKTFGLDNGTLFIKPNEANKLFSGTKIYKRLFERRIRHLNRFDTNINDSYVVVAKPVEKIDNEYRFVVNGSEIITGSLYRNNNNMKHRCINKNENVFKFAQKVINKSFNLKFDPIWAIDIAEINNILYILEVNPFSCSGLYECDLDIIMENLKQLDI